MAKRFADMVSWEPPPPTKEEALAPEYEDMGDRALNDIIGLNPRTPSEWEIYEQKREAQKKAIREAEFQKGRRFEIDVSNKTGR